MQWLKFKDIQPFTNGWFLVLNWNTREWYKAYWNEDRFCDQDPTMGFGPGHSYITPQYWMIITDEQGVPIT